MQNDCLYKRTNDMLFYINQYHHVSTFIPMYQPGDWMEGAVCIQVCLTKSGKERPKSRESLRARSDLLHQSCACFRKTREMFLLILPLK